VESASAETRRVPPPLLYDLTDLQRHANRLYGMSAKDTLLAKDRRQDQFRALDNRRLFEMSEAGRRLNLGLGPLGKLM
jgi:DNA topoisomerase-3